MRSHHHHFSKSRRKFIQQTGCAAMGYSTLLSSLLNIKAMGAAAMSDCDVIADGNYKAIVCISLDGGNDSFNMVVPHTQAEYNKYSQIRGGVYNQNTNPAGIAIPRGNLRVLNSLNTPGRTFGLHPSMPKIQQLFNQGKAAFISNIGTLVQPITRQEFWDDAVPTPLALLSHADQQQQWMTGLPSERSGIGWGGKIADMINDMYNPAGSALSMNISLNGSNVFQTGNQTVEYSINGGIGTDGGAKEIYGYDDSWLYPQLRKNAINSMLEQTYSDIYERTYINTLKNSAAAYQVFNESVNNIEVITPFPNFNSYGEMAFANGLNKIVQTIGARETLGFNRQTFFINYGGWDHHDEVRDAQTFMLGAVDDSLAAFQAALEEKGLQNDVLTFVISDFSRTLGSNGNGTDHAWGGNVFVLGGSDSTGGPLKGQRIYGNYPSSLLFNENGIDVGGGVLIPSTSTDVYFAEIAHWFGVSKSNLELIFPNIRNFYQYESTTGTPMNMLSTT